MSSNIPITSLPRITSSELSSLLLLQQQQQRQQQPQTTPETTTTTSPPPVLSSSIQETTQSPSHEEDHQKKNNQKSIAIIDVRDEDHIGGHITSSLHYPSRTLEGHLPELVKKLEDKDIVVFHCSLSQQRGPKAARAYLEQRERERERLKKVGGESDGGDGEGGEKVEDGKGKQEVYVLDRGFVGWQEEYGTNPSLTEAYVKDIWEEY